MKLINKIICGAGISLMMLASSACSDMLDTKPQGVFSQDQINDESVEGVLAAAYQGLANRFFPDNNNPSFAGPITNWIFDVRSDDAYKGGGGVSMEQGIHQLEIANYMNDNASVFNKWENNYLAISRCNQALRIVEASTVNNKESIKAELRTLRAYFYFDLIRIYQKIPYFDENQNPNEVRADEYTRDQIYQMIKDELAECYTLLPVSQADPGRFNRYVAAAIHAKVSAMTSSWNEVEYYSNEVIASGKYQLYNNFLDMSKIEFNNQFESVMAIQFSNANAPSPNINWSNLLNTTTSEGNLYGNGDDFFLASQDLANAFRTDSHGLPYLNGDAPAEDVSSDYDGNVDPRIDFTMGRIGMPWRGYTYTEKWCRAYDVYGDHSGKKGMIDPNSPLMIEGFPWGASPLNFCLIRYADILLLKAEALIEQNKQLDEARLLINSVRAKAKRSVDPSYAPVDCDPNKAWYAVEEYPAVGWSQDYARKAVRMERRLELAMEGHRWFDLVRWGNVVETMNAYYAKERLIRTYYEGANLTADEVYFPIPLNQVENSGGLYE